MPYDIINRSFLFCLWGYVLSLGMLHRAQFKTSKSMFVRGPLAPYLAQYRPNFNNLLVEGKGQGVEQSPCEDYIIHVHGLP